MPDRRRAWHTVIIAMLALIAIAGLLIMAKGQQMNQDITPFNGRNNVVLAQAVARGDVKSIAEQATQAHLREQGDHQITLLQWAILSQQPQSLSALLEQGADVSIPGLDGNSALHTASAVQDPQYLRLLLSYGVPINPRNAVTGATPLAVAVLAGREEQLRLLLVSGADVTLSDRLGDTPLHVAAKITAPQLALMLLQAGADAKARNQQGMTFQFYFSQTPTALQSEEMRDRYRQLNAWLKAHQQATHYVQQ